MSIEKKLDAAFTELKERILTSKCPECISPNNTHINKIPIKSELLESNNNDICMVGNTEIPCNVDSVDNFYKIVNQSRYVNRRIPEQIKNNNYDNIYINKTFKDGKSCRMRGTNQQIWLENKKSPPNIGIDSDGYCILRGTNIG